MKKRKERRASVNMEGILRIRVSTNHLLYEEEKGWMDG